MLVTNTYVLWTSTYLGDALDSLRCEAQVLRGGGHLPVSPGKQTRRQAMHLVYAFAGERPKARPWGPSAKRPAGLTRFYGDANAPQGG